MKIIMNIEQTLKDGNSTTNQNIKQKFVGQHVYCNVNTMVEFILSASSDGDSAPFSYDDVENNYSYPEYRGDFAEFDGGDDDDRTEEIERLRGLIEGLTNDLNDVDGDEFPAHHKREQYEAKIEKIEEEISDLEQLETEPSDIMEWWAVSDFLYRKLREKGHPVLDAGSCYVWGRCTSGQAILLDYVITQICAEMGILDGQENSWK
jgi:hypothetical protein